MEKLKNLFLKIFVTLQVEGLNTFVEKSLRRLQLVKKYTYQDWIRDFEEKDFSDGALLKFKPKFTFLVFDSESNDSEVEKTRSSIEKQPYTNFETISLKSVKTEGLTWKNLLNTVQGDYLLPIKADDQISPNALFEIAKLSNEQDLDLIYSDEDFVDQSGKRETPVFKPDYAPEFLETYNYIGNLIAIKKEALGKTFLKDSIVEWSNYQLVLALKEISASISHIPKVLYHNRKPRQGSSDRRVLQEHLKRLGREAQVEETPFQGVFETREKLKGSPKVTIVILCGGNWQCLKSCLKSIFEKTTYKNFEVVAVDNTLDETFEKKIQTNFKRVIYKKDWEKPFNFSKLNNRAVNDLKTDYLLLLNDDTEIISPDWIEALLEQGQKEDVGVVGAKLLYPNQTVQQAGIIVGYNGGRAGNAFVGERSDSPGYQNRLVTLQNYSAVTGACMLVKKEIYEQVGGLDESLAVAFNDVDFCLKIIKAGSRVVWTPYAQLIHKESISRGEDLDLTKKTRLVEEENYFKKKWEDRIEKGDPYYNSNLSLNVKTFELRRK